MGDKCYISFKTEDRAHKEYIQSDLNVDMIDKSLDEPIESNNADYILRKIREDYLADSTVTIHLIGQYSAESLGKEEQLFIKRELQASLYNSQANPRMEFSASPFQMSSPLSFRAPIRARRVGTTTIGSQPMTALQCGSSGATTTSPMGNAAIAKTSAIAFSRRGKRSARLPTRGST